ncbi:M14 family metallopeptidase [Lampropedia puyangensis]|nr:M14 family metallopeptidase [Lampropedia puyangensis]
MMTHEKNTAKGLRFGAVALAAMLLAACSTTPLPPWPGGDKASATPTKRLPPGASTVELGVVGQSDYSSAVAARFPDPEVRYATPGLQEGRSTYSSNEEIRAYLRDAAASAPTGVTAQLQSIGQSQQGADIHALFIAKGPGASPSDFANSGKPTVLFVGQQHGDEPAGSEALLVAARQLLGGPLSDTLNAINVIVLPRANPDGAAADTRTLANQIDLNRDHLLLRTPEARALARLVRDYRPSVIVDNHEYTVAGRFQSKFQGVQAYDAMLQFANTPNIGEFVVKASNEWFTEPVFAALKADKLTAQWYYTTSTDPQDLTLAMGGIRPDTGRNVNGLKNAVSLLIETRGIGIGRTHIQRRVHTHVVAIGKVLEQAAARASHLKQVQAFVARDAASQACQGTLVIDAAQTQQQRDITMLDPNTGADVVRNLPWKSSLQIRPTLERKRPCGYLLAGSESDAVSRLQMMGVSVLRVAEAGSLQVDQYTETSREEGTRQDVRGAIGGEKPVTRVKVQLTPQRVDVPSGSFYVPMGQPLANLAAAALEPDTQNSYFANGIQHDLGNVVRVTEPPALVFEEVE